MFPVFIIGAKLLTARVSEEVRAESHFTSRVTDLINATGEVQMLKFLELKVFSCLNSPLGD